MYTIAGWELNPNWRNLTFLDLAGEPLSISRYVSVENGGTFTGSDDTAPPVGTIMRGSFAYPAFSRATRTKFVDSQDKSLTIAKTETGYKWSDRQGNWIEYNFFGIAQAYGDKNDVKVSFVRDSQGRVIKINDHFDKEVITYDYSDPARLVVSDYAGRQVIYSGDFRFMDKVTDVRGNDWLYEYTNILGASVLTKKTDPELRETLIGQVKVSGGVQRSGAANGTAATWTVEEYVDPETGETKVREVLIGLDGGAA